MDIYIYIYIYIYIKPQVCFTIITSSLSKLIYYLAQVFLRAFFPLFFVFL